MAAEEWENPTSSGGVDVFDAVVRDARYDFLPDYNDGNTLCLLLDVKSDDTEVGFEGTGEMELRFPCGENWEKKDSAGTAAVHPGDKPDKPKKFNNNSGMGYLLESAKEIPALVKVVSERGSTRDAGVWQGLNVEWTRKEVTFGGMKDEETGEPVKARRWIITGFNGEGSDAKPASDVKAADKPATSSNGSVDLTAVQKVGLKKLAGESESLSQFQDKVLTAMPEFAEGALTNWVLDDGCWEQAKAF